MDLRRKKVVATLVFPLKNGKVLLARKMKKIGVGLWNGWGGGQEEGETIRQAARREFQEESGCEASLDDFEYVGKVTFHNQKPDGRKLDVEVHMFLLKKWEGEPQGSSEMSDPTWFPLNSLPFSGMMASDKDWLPQVISGEYIEGEVWYDLENQSLSKPTKIRVVQKLDNID